MSKEVARRHFLDDEGTPIVLIHKGHADRDGEQQDEFLVRSGNRTVKTFSDSGKAEAFVEALGGRATADNSALLVAAEIDGTAAHQAAHAEDTERLGKLIDERIQNAQMSREARARGDLAPVFGGDDKKLSKKEETAVTEQHEAEQALADAPDDSQATGVAPMHLGLAPDVTPPLVERVPGALEEETAEKPRRSRASDKKDE